jgi:GMP synthase-like glutamine amidotransferase
MEEMIKMRAHYLQHVPFEGLGSIEPWLRKAGYEIGCTRLYESEALPPSDSFDLLIVMGGPMSVNDETEHPWLMHEKGFIAEVIDTGCPVLGICLGAQLIASALGAKVYPNRLKEIGWYPVTGLPPAADTHFSFPESLEVFHWHGETFELPPGAIHLARSEGCEHQAFLVAPKVMGLQFHLETTAESAKQIVSHCRDELLPSRFVQSETEILAEHPERYAAINNVMGEILGWLTSDPY